MTIYLTIFYRHGFCGSRILKCVLGEKTRVFCSFWIVWQNFYTWPTNKDLRNLYNKGCRNVEPRILKARMKRKECQHYSLYWSKDSSHACSWGRKILVPGRYVSTKTHLLWHMKHVVPMYCFRSPKRSRNVATKPELRTKHSERIYLPWTLFEFDVS